MLPLYGMDYWGFCSLLNTTATLYIIERMKSVSNTYLLNTNKRLYLYLYAITTYINIIISMVKNNIKTFCETI